MSLQFAAMKQCISRLSNKEKKELCLEIMDLIEYTNEDTLYYSSFNGRESTTIFAEKIKKKLDEIKSKRSFNLLITLIPDHLHHLKIWSDISQVRIVKVFDRTTIIKCKLKGSNRDELPDWVNPSYLNIHTDESNNITDIIYSMFDNYRYYSYKRHGKSTYGIIENIIGDDNDILTHYPEITDHLHYYVGQIRIIGEALGIKTDK